MVDSFVEEREKRGLLERYHVLASQQLDDFCVGTNDLDKAIVAAKERRKTGKFIGAASDLHFYVYDTQDAEFVWDTRAFGDGDVV